eukprot:GHVU01201820.1.p1 GENE.GHVU01201820.1~~GHVU01201820.1.p1  ORF type:complete len:665 (+),score=144.38 GHVU01201820.1:508-2502(+)
MEGKPTYAIGIDGKARPISAENADPFGEGQKPLDEQKADSMGKTLQTEDIEKMLEANTLQEDDVNSSNADDESEAEEEEEEDSKNGCERCCVAFGSALVPTTAPLIYLGVHLVVVLIAFFVTLGATRFAAWMPLTFYYGIFFAIFLGVMLVRYIIIFLFMKVVLRENLIVAAIVSVLDPLVIYFAWTLVFFLASRALWTEISWNNSTQYQLVFLQAVSLSYPITPTANKLLGGAEFLLMLICAKNLILNGIMFYFELGFHMNLNPVSSKYLRIYGILRTLSVQCMEPPEVQEKQGGFLGILRDARSPNNTALPTALTKKNIQATKKKKLANWLSIQYLVQYLPVLFVKDTRVEVRNRKIALLAGSFTFRRLREMHAAEAQQQQLQTVSSSFDAFDDSGDAPRQHVASEDGTSITEVKTDDDVVPGSVLRQLLSEDDAAELMAVLDVGGNDKVARRPFLRCSVEVYKTRHAFLTVLKSQIGIQQVLRGLINVLLMFVLVLIFMLYLGANPNTILVSGFVLLATISMTFSFLYSTFIRSVMFVVFLNPYNVGDRVRLGADGELLHVCAINTFCTHFETLTGKKLTIMNTSLEGKGIVNESRAGNAVFEFAMNLPPNTPSSAIDGLSTSIRRYTKARPMEFVRDTFFFMGYEAQPGVFYRVSEGVRE